MEGQRERLLPIGYYHGVFTVASELRELFAYNRRLLYGLLFAISSNILKAYAKDPKWLGGQIGFTGILHTWGQQLQFHPHIHYIITGGGIDAQGHWVEPKQGGAFLFPVVEMSSRFKNDFLRALKRLHQKGKLIVPESLDFMQCLKESESKSWEIFLQPPMKSPDKLLNYLGRYTHRVAKENFDKARRALKEKMAALLTVLQRAAQVLEQQVCIGPQCAQCQRVMVLGLRIAAVKNIDSS